MKNNEKPFKNQMEPYEESFAISLGHRDIGKIEHEKIIDVGSG